jgi:hypothetical protein
MATSSGQGARPPPSQPTRGTPGQRFDEPGQFGPKQGAGKLGDYRIVRTLGEGSFGKVRCMTPPLSPQQNSICFVVLGVVTDGMGSGGTSEDKTTCCSQVY